MSVNTGAFYVQNAADICNSLGFSVWVPEKELCRPWDLLINGHKVQVKYRSVCTSNRNRVRLKTYLRPRAMAYDKDAFAYLVLYWNQHWFVIKSQLLLVDGGMRNALHMPHFCRYRDKWDLLSDGKVVMEIQSSFDF
jgi:hypothetical protein